MKHSQLKTKGRGKQSYSPTKIRMNESPKLKELEASTPLKLNLLKAPVKRKRLFSTEKKMCSSKNMASIQPVQKLRRPHRKLVKGTSAVHDVDKMKKLNSRIFSCDNFGDADTTVTQHSRKCNMDLSQFVSDSELETIKAQIFQTLNKN